MKRRSRWLGIASLAAVLTFAPQAAGRAEPKAKFRVVSARGWEALSFHEDGETSTGARCIGWTESQVRWRLIRPATVYVFVFRYGGKLGTSLSADRVGEKYESVPLFGEALTSRSVNYPDAAGCQEQPTSCPETTAPARPFLTGTYRGTQSVSAGLDVVHVPPGFADSCRGAGEIAFGVSLPFGNAAMRTLLPEITAAARVIPRRELLNPRRKRLRESVTVEESLSGTHDAADRATVSGVYAVHLSVTLKRLTLR